MGPRLGGGRMSARKFWSEWHNDWVQRGSVRGVDFVGVELDPDHHAIAMARIEHAAAVAPETNRADYEPPKKKQLGLF